MITRFSSVGSGPFYSSGSTDPKHTFGLMVHSDRPLEKNAFYQGHAASLTLSADYGIKVLAGDDLICGKKLK